MKFFCFAHSAATPHGLPGQALKYLAAAGLWALLMSMSAFSQPATPAVSCESLARLALPQTTITMAQSVAAGEFKIPDGIQMGSPGRALKAPPAFCRVAATLKPSSDSNIKIEIWLPLSGWNGRLLGAANVGWAGMIMYEGLIEGVQRGYAAASTDAGHDASVDGKGGSFVLGHPEKLIDYGYRAVHEMTVKAKAVAATYYGTPPKHAYWSGCSLGGMQGFNAAHHFPEDYDGIIVGGSGNPFALINAAQLYPTWLISKNPARFIPESKYAMIHEAVIKACDGLDGIVDGVIDDPRACPFDLKQLQCQGPDSPNCLTAPQVELMQKIYAGAINPRTKEQIFPGSALGSELKIFEFANRQEPMGPALDLYKYVVFQDPNWDWKTLNYDSDVALAVKRAGPFLHTDPADLKPFFDRGGKLLIWDGWNDYNSPPHWINYYSAVQKILGASKAASSVRLFLMPGVDHCAGGAGCDTFDKLSTLEQWVENGNIPERIVASHLTNGKVTRTRPLCAYPMVAKYKGTGSTDDAENFVCTEEKPVGKR